MSTTTPVVDNVAENALRAAAPPQVDMSSILAKMQDLEQSNNKLLAAAAQKDERLEKLIEGKKQEMQQVLQTTIARFIADLETKDEKTKEDLTASLTSFANDGRDTGVWEVMACASTAHVARVTELENLRIENNALKEREQALSCGVFGNETARMTSNEDQPQQQKRKAEDISEPTNMWDDFQSMLNNSGGISSHFTQ
jgi:hypothetical protein